MKTGSGSIHPPSSRRTLLSRLGWAGFLFFLAKGIAWLALGTWLAL